MISIFVCNLSLYFIMWDSWLINFWLNAADFLHTKITKWFYSSYCLSLCGLFLVTDYRGDTCSKLMTQARHNLLGSMKIFVVCLLVPLVLGGNWGRSDLEAFKKVSSRHIRSILCDMYTFIWLKLQCTILIVKCTICVHVNNVTNYTIIETCQR